MIQRPFGFFVVFTVGLTAQTLPEAKQFAPTGTLRVTFLGNNAVQGKVDSKTGAVTGPVADITRELGRRLGVPFQITPAPGVIRPTIRSPGSG